MLLGFSALTDDDFEVVLPVHDRAYNARIRLECRGNLLCPIRARDEREAQ
jgi:hypothetical protein